MHGLISKNQGLMYLIDWARVKEYREHSIVNLHKRYKVPRCKSVSKKEQGVGGRVEYCKGRAKR